MSSFVETCIADPPTSAGWVPLPWDTEQFGFPAARLELDVAPDHLQSVLQECRRAGIRHVTARPDATDRGTIRALENHGFELLDAIQTFECKIEEHLQTTPETTITVRPFRAADLDQVRAIARTAFVYDRFHADEALAPGVADRIHVAWIDNCCRGIMADVVWVAQDAGKILGFVTCKVARTTRSGDIGLVATHEDARRRGVARDLTARALNWFRQERALSVRVGTQITNIPAARLYQSLGFAPFAVSFTFRRLL